MAKEHPLSAANMEVDCAQPGGQGAGGADFGDKATGNPALSAKWKLGSTPEEAGPSVGEPSLSTLPELHRHPALAGWEDRGTGETEAAGSW